MIKDLSKLLNENKSFKIHLINKYVEYLPNIIYQMSNEYKIRDNGKILVDANNYITKCLKKYVRRIN